VARPPWDLMSPGTLVSRSWAPRYLGTTFRLPFKGPWLPAGSRGPFPRMRMLAWYSFMPDACAMCAASHHGDNLKARAA
jgi:hypothetical protein